MGAQIGFQETFVSLIKKQIPAHISLVDELAELLSISKDSAYRRLRGETPLSLDETVKICLHFDISPASLLEQATELIPFKYNKLYNEKDSFLHYLKSMTATLNLVSKANGQVIYASEDIPLFHHFGYPMLGAFKLFYWNKAVLSDEGLQDKVFSTSLLHPDISAAASDLLNAYREVKSIEIWTEESINSTLKQILYFAESDQFASKEDAIKIVDEMDHMIHDLARMAEHNSKKPDNPAYAGNYTFFNSEVLIGNNSIIIEGLDKPIVFLSHNTFNSLSTRDQSFYEETKEWMQNLIRKSTMISGVSEKYRIAFFKQLYNSVKDVRDKIEQLNF